MKSRISGIGRLHPALQHGFTMVELAIVLVIAGLILVAVLKGTDTVNKAKVERAVADLRGLQGMVLEHQKRVNRLPGDCDGDGVIELGQTVSRTYMPSGQVPAVDNVQREVAALGVCGTVATAATYAGADNAGGNTIAGVATAGAVVAPDVSNLVWNEMRRSGVVDGHRTNLELARHNFQDLYLFSSMGINLAATNATRANVVVMYGVPVWLAEAIDAEVDGVQADYQSTGAMAGPACNGRVRRWDNSVGAAVNGVHPFSCTAGQFNAGPLDRDDLISISYQLDTGKLIN